MQMRTVASLACMAHRLWTHQLLSFWGLPSSASRSPNRRRHKSHPIMRRLGVLPQRFDDDGPPGRP